MRASSDEHSRKNSAFNIIGASVVYTGAYILDVACVGIVLAGASQLVTSTSTGPYATAIITASAASYLAGRGIGALKNYFK